MAEGSGRVNQRKAAAATSSTSSVASTGTRGRESRDRSPAAAWAAARGSSDRAAAPNTASSSSGGRTRASLVTSAILLGIRSIRQFSGRVHRYGSAVPRSEPGCVQQIGQELLEHRGRRGAVPGQLLLRRRGAPPAVAADVLLAADVRAVLVVGVAIRVDAVDDLARDRVGSRLATAPGLGVLEVGTYPVVQGCGSPALSTNPKCERSVAVLVVLRTTVNPPTRRRGR